MRAFKKIICFLLVNIIAAGILCFAFRPFPQFEMRVDDFLEGDCSSMVIGSSFGHNIVPDLLPDGEKTFDLCSPGIHFNDYYYILRELNKHKDIKRVYLEFSLEYWTGEAGSSNHVNMRRILTGKDEISYIFNVLGPLNYNTALFPYYITSSSIFGLPENVKNKLAVMLDKDYEIGEPEFVEENEEVNMEMVPAVFSKDIVSQEVLKSFIKMSDFCRENDIELIVFSTAFAKERLRAENVGDVHDYFEEFFKKNNVAFYDMNYVKWDLLPRKTEEYIDLHGHMRRPLAERQTKLLAEIMESDDPSAFFVSDYQEVLDGLDKMEKCTYEECG